MVDDDLILVRTHAGQRAVLDEIQLGDIEVRLLRLVNGFTSLGDLTRRLDTRHDWRVVAFDLLDQGYVIESPASGLGLSARPTDAPVEEA